MNFCLEAENASIFYNFLELIKKILEKFITINLYFLIKHCF